MDTNRYSVRVNGIEKSVQLVSVSVGGNNVTLGLEEGAIATSDSLEVGYNILDGKGQPLSGVASASAR